MWWVRIQKICLYSTTPNAKSHYINLLFLPFVQDPLHNKRLTSTSNTIFIPLNLLPFLLPILAQLELYCTFFKIPLTLIAPLFSVLVMNRGLFHLIVWPSSFVRSRSQSGRASLLLHLAPFPIMNSSLGSGGRFLLTRLTVGSKFTVLNPSFFLVLASVRDLSSFWEREVKGGVAGRVGRVDTSIYKSD